jgi:ion channel-forming bestrophin family protein
MQMNSPSEIQPTTAYLKGSTDSSGVDLSIDASTEDAYLTQKHELKGFLASALSWHGTALPGILKRLCLVGVYTMLITFFAHWTEVPRLPMSPFEYSGAVLAFILVMRVNAGHDRWWEARKLWGQLVNQSRNLATVIAAIPDSKMTPLKREILNLVAAWPHMIRLQLRQEPTEPSVKTLLAPHLGPQDLQVKHRPNMIGFHIASALQQLLNLGLPAAVFHRAETERSQIIDAVGACERIRNTRMPFALAVITRRFMLLFILLLPFGLMDKAGWWTPLIVMLASYPLLSLDEIGAELQNPFSPRNISHLPLNDICKTISSNVMELGRLSHLWPRS